MGVAAMLVSCGKKEEVAEVAAEAAAAQPPPEVAMEIEAQFVAPKNPAADTIQERLDGAVHPQLTMFLHKYIETYGRMPENVRDLVSRTSDSTPPVPPGMMYAIDPVDKSVKLVRQ